jgi:phosphatidylethanolamine-binding protein
MARQPLVTASTPQLSLYGAAGSGPFVIIMADPDVPTPQNPTYGPVRHWLAGNFYPSPTTNALTPSGTAITPYFQPTPGAGSPAHR